MAQMYFQYGSTSASMVWFHNGDNPTASTGANPTGTLETPGSWDVSYRLPKSEQVTQDNQMIFSTIAPETRFFSLRWTSIAPITEALANSLKNFYEGTAGGAKNKFTWQDQYGTQRVVHWLGDYSFSELPNDLYEGRITLFEEYTSTADTSAWTTPQPVANPFFQMISWTGSGAVKTITTTVAPMVLWIKERDGSNPWMQFTVFNVADVTKWVDLDSTAAEASDANRVSTVNATTPNFIIGNSTTTNDSTNKYLAAVWYGEANQTEGEFARANVYCKRETASASVITVNHPLLRAPTFIIGKDTQAVGAWYVYHQSLGETKYLVLNTNAAAVTATGVWNDYAPTNTDFQLGTTWPNTGSHILTAFADQAGYLKTGTYTATALAQNIDCGFKPNFLIIKRTDSTGDWIVFTSVGGDNVYHTITGAAETEDPYQLRIHNGGFYLYAGANVVNITTAVYVYAAWAGNA